MPRERRSRTSVAALRYACCDACQRALSSLRECHDDEVYDSVYIMHERQCFADERHDMRGAPSMPIDDNMPRPVTIFALSAAVTFRQFTLIVTDAACRLPCDACRLPRVLLLQLFIARRVAMSLPPMMLIRDAYA